MENRKARKYLVTDFPSKLDSTLPDKDDVFKMSRLVILSNVSKSFTFQNIVMQKF